MNLDVETLRVPTAKSAPTAASPAISELSPETESAWQEYVAHSSGCSPFHELGWKRSVEKTYGHRPRYLLAHDCQSETVLGVLPLFEVTGPLTGRALISVPYAVYGGVAAKSPVAETALYQHAISLAEDRGVRYAEIRAAEAIPGFVSKCHYLTFQKQMPADRDDVLGSYPKKARAAIRHAIKKFSLQSRFGHELLDVFYRLYSVSLRRLGSPPHAKAFFRRVLQEYGDRCVVQVVYHGQTAVAGAISFRFQNQILPYWAGIDVKYNPMNTSNFLYFSLMEHAVGLKLEVFDFGRTRIDNEGGCRFKINQGFEPSPLEYSTYSPGGNTPPDLRPSNRKFSAVQKVWRRLPLGCINLAAGTMTRWLP